MSQINVRPGQLYQSANEMENQCRALESILLTIAIDRSVGLNDSSYAGLKRSLKTVQRNIRETKRSLNTFSQDLDSISRLYVRVETENAKISSGSVRGVIVVNGRITLPQIHLSPDVKKFTKDALAILSKVKTDEEIEKEERDNLIKTIKNVSKTLKELTKHSHAFDNNSASETMGLTFGVSSFIETLLDVLDPNDDEGESDYERTTGDRIDLARDTYGVMEAIYKLAAKRFKMKGGTVSDAATKRVGVMGLLFCLIGTGNDAAEFAHGDAQDKSLSAAEKTGRGITTFGDDGVTFGQQFYTVLKGESTVKPFSEATLWSTLAETIVDTGGQAVESIGKYTKDGDITLEEAAEIGIESSVSGLCGLADGLLFGVPKAVGLDDDAISGHIEDWGKKTGEDIGNKIVEIKRKHIMRANSYMSKHPEMARAYPNATKAERTVMTWYATLMG